jgi:hypothetical protein
MPLLIARTNGGSFWAVGRWLDRSVGECRAKSPQFTSLGGSRLLVGSAVSTSREPSPARAASRVVAGRARLASRPRRLGSVHSPIDCWPGTNRGEGRVHWWSMGAKTAAASLQSWAGCDAPRQLRLITARAVGPGLDSGMPSDDSGPLSADWAQERGVSADLGSSSLPGRPRGVVPGLLVRQSPGTLRKPGAWI